MITDTLKISSQNQITVPTAIRNALGLRAGDYVSVTVEDEKATLYPTGSKWADKTRGVAEKIYSKYGGGDKCLKKERKTWHAR